MLQSPPIKYGIILGLASGILGFVLAGLGLHQNPLMPTLFVIVVFILNIVLIYIALKEMAATSTWGKQVVNGLTLGVIAGVIAFLSSLLMTEVVFTNYYDELLTAQRNLIVNAGLPQEVVEAQLQALDQVTPMASAFQGFLGSVLTSLIASAIIGIFQRTGRE